MKTFFNNIQTLVIVALVVLLFLQRSCSSSPAPTEKVKVDTLIQFDTIEIIKNNYVPQWKEKIVTQIDTIRDTIDTATVIQDYYSKYFYSDTVKVDTIGNLVINDTICQNTIFKRNINTNIVIPTLHVTKTVYVNKTEFYWGLGLGGNAGQINYIGVDFVLKSKNDQAYGFGVGLDNTMKPAFRGSMLWKIKTPKIFKVIK